MRPATTRRPSQVWSTSSTVDDDEVAGRVDDDEHVAELRVVEVKAAARPVVVLEQRPEDLVDWRQVGRTRCTSTTDGHSSSR